MKFNQVTNAGEKTITRGYGMKMHPIHKRMKMHHGIDIPVSTGHDIYAIADGVIIDSETRSDACGGTLKVSHGVVNGKKLYTRFCHCSQLLKKKGDIVKQGEVIAKSGGGKGDPGRGGSTGPHIHFEVYENGSTVDPMPYYKNSVGGEQTELPSEVDLNKYKDELEKDGEIDGSDDDKTSTGAKGYKEIAKSLIKKLFGVENDVTPDVVNEIVEELYRYNELINEDSTSASTTPVGIVDGATQSSANGGTVYTSNKTTSDIRAFSPGGNIEVLSEKAGYQNAVKIGGKYEYYWNGTNKNLTTIPANGVIGTTSDGKVFVKAIGQSVIPLKPGQSGSQTSTTTNTNPYRDSAKSYTAGVLNTLINGKQQAESVKKDFDKILEEEVKNFKRLIR
jgi:hypothetical protein